MATNTTAQYTPDVTISVLNPSVVSLNGVLTNIVDVVGTASWGPVNQSTTLGSYSDFAASFGPMVARKYDGGTIVATAGLNGGSAFTFTRVTDGTDLVANTILNSATIAAKYTGSLGNNINVLFSVGGKANSVSATVTLTGVASEIYPNIPTTNFWPAFAAAINSGTGVSRGPSNLVTVSVSNAAGAAPTAPVTVSLTGGADGVATINASVLVGTDGVNRTGMYATAHSGGQTLVLADCDDSTVWTTVDAFAASNYKLAVLVGPAGDTTANAIARKELVGLDSPYTVLLHGDWVTFDDTVNGTTRKISPQGFYAGCRSNLLPGQTVLNKQVAGVITTERLSSGSGYSVAEMNQLFSNGIELLTNPIPAAAAFGFRGGYNTTSNANENSDSWTTLTNYLAATLKNGMGRYVGEPNVTDTWNSITSTLSHFLDGLETAGILFRNSDGSAPYKILCSAKNNPQSRTGLGYAVADAQITYPGVVRFFNINLTGGATVVTMTSQIV